MMIKEKLKKIIDNKKIYCYGAGNYGKIVGYALLDMKIDFKGFVVSNKNDKLNTLLGKPICELNELNITDSDYILITVNQMLQCELEKKLMERNICNYYCLTEFEMDELDKMTEFEYTGETNKYVDVLLFHRVCYLKTDPWKLAVTPEEFDNQIRYIKENYNVVRFEDDWSNINEKTVVITFDDGYVDNFYNAVPILRKYNIPATFFISTNNIGTNSEFWWDELSSLFYNKENERIKFKYNGIYYNLDTPENLRKSCLEIRSILMNMDPEKRRAELKLLHNIMDIPLREHNCNRTMNKFEIQQLTQYENISIGAHTKSHTRLSHLPVDIQMEEIKGSKEMLEQITGGKIETFSYPFGSDDDYTEKTVELVKYCGIKKAAVVKSGLYCREHGEYKIPRNTIVGGTTARQLKKQIQKNWYEYGTTDA